MRARKVNNGSRFKVPLLFFFLKKKSSSCSTFFAVAVHVFTTLENDHLAYCPHINIDTSTCSQRKQNPTWIQLVLLRSNIHHILREVFLPRSWKGPQTGKCFLSKKNRRPFRIPRSNLFWLLLEWFGVDDLVVIQHCVRHQKTDVAPRESASPNSHWIPHSTVPHN